MYTDSRLESVVVKDSFASQSKTKHGRMFVGIVKALSLCQQTSNDYFEMIPTSTWNVEFLVGKYFHEHIDALHMDHDELRLSRLPEE